VIKVLSRVNFTRVIMLKRSAVFVLLKKFHKTKLSA